MHSWRILQNMSVKFLTRDVDTLKGFLQEIEEILGRVIRDYWLGRVFRGYWIRDHFMDLSRNA